MKSVIYKGEILSSGSAEGIVATLGDETDNKIVVAKRITPLDSFKVVNALGIIVEEGGMLSHIAIYARELGIPCVKLDNATKLLPKCSLVKIHENGTIELFK